MVKKMFGMRSLAQEGAPIHPDYFGAFGGTNAAYLKRLQAYADHHGIEEARRCECSRPEILEKLRG